MQRIPLQAIGWSGRHPRGRRVRPGGFGLAGSASSISSATRPFVVPGGLPPVVGDGSPTRCIGCENTHVSPRLLSCRRGEPSALRASRGLYRVVRVPAAARRRPTRHLQQRLLQDARYVHARRTFEHLGRGHDGSPANNRAARRPPVSNAPPKYDEEGCSHAVGFSWLEMFERRLEQEHWTRPTGGPFVLPDGWPDKHRS